MKVKEMYEYCIKYEEAVMGHYILHALHSDVVDLEDDIEKLSTLKIDVNKVVQLINENTLGFSRIKAYSMKRDNKHSDFILAETKQQAIQEFEKIYRQSPLNCIELPLDKTMARGKEFLSFRDMRKEHEHFPVIVGHAIRDN